MRSSRRAFLASAVGATVVSSGCVEFILGEGPLSFEASKAQVAQSALSGTGFQHLRTEPVTLSETFEVAGQTRTVELTNYVSEYAKSVDVNGQSVQGAVFGALATPVFEIAGQSINPIEGLPTEQLVARAQALYADANVQERLGSLTRQVLGNPVELLKYALAATIGGTALDVLLHLGTLQDAGDALVLAGMNPRILEGEAQNVLALASGLTHATG